MPFERSQCVPWLRVSHAARSVPIPLPYCLRRRTNVNSPCRPIARYQCIDGMRGVVGEDGALSCPNQMRRPLLSSQADLFSDCPCLTQRPHTTGLTCARTQWAK